MRLILERGTLGRDERPDPNHVRLEFLEEAQVFNEVVEGLVRRSDHETGTDLETDFLEVMQALLPVRQAHRVRVKPAVVGFVCGFVS